jgi:hypothetical protein
MNALDGFIDELRANPRTAPHADDIAAAWDAIIEDGNTNGDALEFMDGAEWIMRRHVSLAEKVRALTEYMALKGKVRVRFNSRGDRITMKRI